MAVIAVKIGGSVLAPKEIDLRYVRRVSAVLTEISKKHNLFIVVGGGGLARKFIVACRKLGADESYLDEVGIEASRMNARVLISALGNIVYHLPALDFNEAVRAGHKHRIVVMGGTHPGHTTDAVCAMLAEKVKADRMVITTNVDGIYTEDPKKSRKAQLLRNVAPMELMELCGQEMGKAGSSGAVDPIAAKIIARSNIPTAVVHGRKIKNMEAAILGKEFKGTIIGLPRKGGK
jgi:uridylate kinase